jgi:hypothetical protein
MQTARLSASSNITGLALALRPGGTEYADLIPLQIGDDNGWRCDPITRCHPLPMK